MPRYRQVKVEVLGGSVVPLEEYGELTNGRMKMVSCFIQSETNRSFRIGIQPDRELLRRDQPQAEGGVDEFGRDNTRRSKPWHFIATLRLDGRKDIEKRDVVILDRNHEDFKDPDGYVKLKGVTLRNQSGVWKQCDWVFKDVGIDITFENLELNGEDPEKAPAQPEEDLANAFGAMSASKLNEAGEPSKVGQIEVRLDRITLGKVVSGCESSDDDEKEMTQLPGSAIGRSEHTVGRAEYKDGRAPNQTQYFHHFDSENAPYAIFRFNYCDEKKLRKLGFLAPLPPTPSSASKRGEALKMAAAVQKKKLRGGPNADKFRNLETADVDDGADADDEKSESGREDGDEDDETGPSKNLPLGDLGQKLGELRMDRTRKHDGEGEEEGEKKVRTE